MHRPKRSKKSLLSLNNGSARGQVYSSEYFDYTCCTLDEYHEKSCPPPTSHEVVWKVGSRVLSMYRHPQLAREHTCLPPLRRLKQSLVSKTIPTLTKQYPLPLGLFMRQSPVSHSQPEQLRWYFSLPARCCGYSRDNVERSLLTHHCHALRKGNTPHPSK